MQWKDDIVAQGVGGGGKARVAAYAASCFGYLPDSYDVLPGVHPEVEQIFGRSSTWQHLVFFDSPNLVGAALGDFIQCLDSPGGDNQECWILGTTTTDPASNLEFNEPVIVTNATSNETAEERQLRAENANLLTLAHLPKTSQSSFGQSFAFTAAVNLGYPYDNAIEFDTNCIDFVD